MTEILEGNTDNSLSSENLESKTQEKYFTQEQLNEIVRGVKEAEKRLAATQPDHFMEKYGLKNHYASHAGQTPNDLEALKNQVVNDVKSSFLKEQEELRNSQLNQAVHHHLKDLRSKIESSKEKYPDYDSVIGSQLDKLHLYPNVAVLANISVDNPDDVMAELFNDELELLKLEQAAKDNFHLVEKQVKKISNAIKQSHQIESTKQHRQPISQMRPSNNGVALGNKKDIDFYKKYL